MKASLDRWLIALCTALLIVISVIMMVLTSPSMLVGIDESAPIDLIVERNESDIDIIDLNTATTQELMRLPNLGEVTAERIINYRDNQGPFRAVEDLLNVDGVGEKRLAQWRAYLVV